MLLYDMLHDKAQNLNYGSYAKKNTSPEQNLGSQTQINQFIWRVYFNFDENLGLGIFQNDLAHRFNVSETTVSTLFNTWVRFMSCFTVHSSSFSRGKIAPGTSPSLASHFHVFFFHRHLPFGCFELFQACYNYFAVRQVCLASPPPPRPSHKLARAQFGPRLSLISVHTNV